jgi:hypothetical protein
MPSATFTNWMISSSLLIESPPGSAPAVLPHLAFIACRNKSSFSSAPPALALAVLIGSGLAAYLLPVHVLRVASPRQLMRAISPHP